MSNAIRNIAQSVQEREIVKTAPDVVVYLEGRPFLVNPYINNKDARNQSDGLYTVVPFNDYVDAFTVSYQVDNLVPSGSFSLSVPESQKYLFQAPGGNNILEPMMQVQVFAKGYFPSQNGNTLYYRVFKGLLTNVSHADTGTSLQITANCQGVIHFLDLMHVDTMVGLLTNSPTDPAPFESNQYLMSPYMMLADMFLRSVTPEGFQLVSLQQDSVKDNTSDWTDAIRAKYINRWQTILTNVMRDVRILGYNVQDRTKLAQQEASLKILHDTFSKEPEDSVGKQSFGMRGATNSRVPQMSLVDQVSDTDYFIDIMRSYLPDYRVDQIQLLGGKIVARSERLRLLANLIGYEGYQDLDGAIIFKPPFYNLDVSNDNLGQGASTQSGQQGSGTSGATSAASYIRQNANPFVVYLSEIESETETEDENNVKVTRMLIQPDFLPNFHMNTPRMILPAIDHIDIAKLTKFGLREQPARQLSYLGAGDKIGMYTYAVSELNRANRGYRTYSFTIPIRPEIRLGFPMYIPHRDMYGYINSVSISYQQGASATMQIVLDTIRKRILVPGYTTIKDANGQDRDITTYTSQPHLVMQWTVSPSKTAPSSPTPPSSPEPFPASGGWRQDSSSGSTGLTPGGTESTNRQVNIIGTPTTLPQVPASPFHKEEWEYIMHQKETLGTLYATRFDTKTRSFRVQNDLATADDATMTVDKGDSVKTNIAEGKPFFRRENWPNGIDYRYYKKIQTCQPYTDEKGYEVVSPFPWGRWVDVNTAIRHSRLGTLSQSANVQGAGTVQAMNVFLFAGLATPNSNDMSTVLNKALNTDLSVTVNGQPGRSGYDSVELDSVIEIITPTPGQGGQVPDDASLTSSSQPDMVQQVIQSDVSMLTNRIDMFVTGGASLPDTQPLKGTQGAVAPSPTPPAVQVAGQPFVIPPSTGGTGEVPIAG